MVVADAQLDPERLQWVEQRLDALHGAARKHRIEIDQLPAFHERLQADISDLEQARSALRFTLSENVTAAIPPGDETIYRMAETLGAQFTPLSATERVSLLASSRDLNPIFKS